MFPDRTAGAAASRAKYVARAPFTRRAWSGGALSPRGSSGHPTAPPRQSRRCRRRARQSRLRAAARQIRTAANATPAMAPAADARGWRRRRATTGGPQARSHVRAGTVSMSGEISHGSRKPLNASPRGRGTPAPPEQANRDPGSALAGVEPGERHPRAWTPSRLPTGSRMRTRRPPRQSAPTSATRRAAGTLSLARSSQARSAAAPRPAPDRHRASRPAAGRAAPSSKRRPQSPRPRRTRGPRADAPAANTPGRPPRGQAPDRAAST